MLKYTHVIVFLSLQVNFSRHDAWRAAAAGPYVLFHHRALISPVIRFVTANPHHATVPAWRPAKQKWRFAAKMALCSHHARPRCHFHLLSCSSRSSLLLFAPLLVSPLSGCVPFCIKAPFSSLFSLLFQNLIVMRPGYSQDNAIARWAFEAAVGDGVNAIHSILIRIHYITLDRGAVQPSICHFLRNGDNRRKKNLHSHQISLATVNNGYFHQGYCNEEMVMRRQWFRGVSTRRAGRRGRSWEDKGK